MALPPVIAIVDDDREMREALCDLFLVERIACQSFGSAEALLAAHAPGMFAAVVTDVRMPGLSGLALLAQLRRLEPDLAIIVVTSATDEQIRQQALRAGAAAFLVKPLRNAELLNALRPFLD